MKKQLSILLLDDHSLFLEGIKSLLKKEFTNSKIFSFSSIKQLTDSNLNYNNFDILISDLELPGENIFPFLKDIKNKYKLPILVISMHQKISLIKKCKTLGIDGYILKHDDEFLIEAIYNLTIGETYYSQKITHILSEFSLQTKFLSEREEDVIRCICAGESNQMIANKLFVTIETVKTHKKNIKIKLGLKETYEIIDFAKKNILF